MGKALGERLDSGRVIALQGPLGAGKTCLVKGIAAGAGVADLDAVKSPTYVIHHVYAARSFRLHHVDAYRLSGPAEYESLDVAGAMAPGDVLVVEWADRVAEALPRGVEWIEIVIPDSGNGDERVIRVGAHGFADAAWTAR